MPKVREHQLELPSLASLTAQAQSLTEEVTQARGAYPTLGARLDNTPLIRREILALPTVTTPEVAPGASHAGEVAVPDPVIMVVRVSIAPQASVSAFRFELFGDPGRQALLYRFDTSRIQNYAAGSPIFDPEAGYDAMPMRNVDGQPVLYYTVYNDDAAVASAFTIAVDIEKLVLGA